MNNSNTQFEASISYSELILQKNKKQFYQHLLSYLNTKNRLQKYLMRVLIIIIFVLFIWIIIEIYSLIQIKSNITVLLPKLDQVKEITTENKNKVREMHKKKLATAIKMARLQYQTIKTSNISSIIEHEMKHISNKMSPHYHHFRQVLSQSVVLRGLDDVGQLYNWFPSSIFLNQEIIMELLYRGTRDGDDIKSFHEKCDKQDSTLLLVRTKIYKNLKKYLVGGFSTVQVLTKRDSWVHTGLTYIFSLDSNTKYRNEKIFNSVIEGFNVMLSYDNGLVLSDRYLNNDKGMYLDVPKHIKKKDKQEPYIGKYYMVEDVEVFRVYVKKKDSFI